MRKILFLVLTGALLLAGCNEQDAPRIISDGSAQADMSGLEAKAVKIIREGLDDRNPGIRSHAIETVATTGRRDLMPKVLNLLEDQNIAVRFTAAIAVGDMSYAAAEYAVKKLLEDENPNGRIAAAYSLVKLGKGDYAQWIRNMAMNRDQTVRANAALLLGKIGGSQNVPVLYEILRAPDSTDKSKLQAVEAIAMTGDQKIYKDRLWPLLISKYADDRVMGIRGMGAMGTADAGNAILTMLSDEVQEVRLCAAEQLARLGDKSGLADVQDYLAEHSKDRDDDSIAMVFSAMAIGRFNDQSLTRYLPALLASRSRVVQISAAQSALLLTKAG